MIVRLQRPAGGVGPWLLYSEDETVADVIEPTRQIEATMPEASAWFEAERTATGWDIVRRLDSGRA